MAFRLHSQLVKDCVKIGTTDLCQVLLANDARFPWIILVPRQTGLRELHDLPPFDQIQVMAEITHISQALQETFGAEKTNIAALGNMVPQLHIHIIMRYSDDVAWPAPVWGTGTAEPYTKAGLKETRALVKSCLP